MPDEHSEYDEGGGKDEEEEEDEEVDSSAYQYAVEGDSSGLSMSGRHDAQLLEQVMVGTNDEPQQQQQQQQSPDEDDDCSESSMDTLDGYAEAKSLIVWFEKEHDPKSKKARSFVWDTMQCCKLSHPDALNEMMTLDSEAFNKYSAADANDNAYMYLCKICYDNPEEPLHKCFYMGQKSGTGNLDKHVNNKHGIYGYSSTVIPPIRGTKRSSPSTSITSTKKGRKKASKPPHPAPIHPATFILQDSPLKSKQPKKRGAGKVAQLMKTSSPGGTLASGNRISVGGTTISTKSTGFFNKVKSQGQVNAWDEYNFLLHQFVNNNNIPTRVVTDPQNCPEYFDLIEFVRRSGKNLKALKQKSMRKQQYATYKKNLFEGLLAAFEFYILQSREFYKSLLRKDHPFISIGHDIWDSSQKEVLGVTVF